jgi:ornithine cyclodeaminase
MRFITAQEVFDHVDMAGLIAALRKDHMLDKAQCERLRISCDVQEVTNQMLISPAWQGEEALGVKLAAIFPANAESPKSLPNEHGLYILFNAKTGQPDAVIDASALTPLKTAADSALAATYLAPKNAERLLIVGSGPIAEAAARAHLTASSSLSSVVIWNRTANKAKLLADKLSASGISASFTEDLSGAVRAADIISCATASCRPLIKGEWVKPGTHIDLIGSYTPQMRESDDELMLKSKIFVDTRELTITGSGDLVIPISKGILSPSDVVADLFELCCGDVCGRHGEQEITLFKNCGGAHLDLMVAKFINRAVSRDL